MESAQSTRLLIVDGHAYAYRAFHAIRRLTAPDGAPTNAIFGFIKMSERLRLVLRPSHMTVIWDGGLSEARLSEHPEYKSQRPPMPEGLGTQIDEIQRYLDAAGISSLCEDAVEADDWIGTIARKAAPEMPVVIASADKDFMQLVSDRIGLINPNDKAEAAERVWTADEVIAKAGVAPDQIVDWLSLMGDSVDNIPGVTGVGPKTASDLLRQFGSIDGIYGQLDTLKSEKLREALRESRETLERNRRLIALRPIAQSVGLDDLAVKEPDRERLRELYEQWGFRGLRAALDGVSSEAEIVAGRSHVQQALL